MLLGHLDGSHIYTEEKNYGGQTPQIMAMHVYVTLGLI